MDKIIVIRTDKSASDFWSRSRNNKQITSDFKIIYTKHDSFYYNQRFTPYGIQNPPTFGKFSRPRNI